MRNSKRWPRGPWAPEPETGERVAARRAFETLEALLAGGVDLAAVEGGAVLLVADDLVGLVERGKAVLRLRHQFGFWSG